LLVNIAADQGGKIWIAKLGNLLYFLFAFSFLQVCNKEYIFFRQMLVGYVSFQDLNCGPSD
jgi:hypothetical protein